MCHVSPRRDTTLLIWWEDGNATKADAWWIKAAANTGIAHRNFMMITQQDNRGNMDAALSSPACSAQKQHQTPFKTRL